MSTLPERGKGSMRSSWYKEVLVSIILQWHFGRVISISPFSRNHSDFLKLVELCKGLVVLPCLISLVEMNGIRDPMANG
jgi:hypothetical protein